MKLHEQEGGSAQGRRYGLEVLNKSAIVLLTAFWEAYCEDLAAEALNHLIEHSKTATALPLELRKQISAGVNKAQHELEAWKLADDGWRAYLRERLETLTETRNRNLNTPKTSQINELFKSAVGIPQMSAGWKLSAKMPPSKASAKLDKFVELRGSIAHRGQHASSVKKVQVVDYFEFLGRLTAKTGGEVNRYVKTATGSALWQDRSQ